MHDSLTFIIDVDNKVPFRDSIQEFTTPSKLSHRSRAICVIYLYIFTGNSRDSILGFTTPGKCSPRSRAICVISKYSSRGRRIDRYSGRLAGCALDRHRR